MKTIYLIFWIINAILLAKFCPYFKDAVVLFIFNVLVPLALLFVRLLILHEKGNEIDKNIPI